MTREDKELLLKDLCARLPYGVKIEFTWWVMDEGTCDITTLEPDHIEQIIGDEVGNAEIKPYLFPMSSMTEEQKKEYDFLRDSVPTYHYEFGDVIVDDTKLCDNWKSIDYLNAHHFDYRGLIEKGLAIDATNLNIY